MRVDSFKDLIVWQKAKGAAVETYKLTKQLPKDELYALTSQMRRAAISISSNIAEGHQRMHKKEKRQFLSMAYASAGELESQLAVAEELYGNLHGEKLEGLLHEIQKMLNTMIHRLRPGN